MKIATIKTKRSVPLGAKDLDLYDEQEAWKCDNCNATANYRDNIFDKCESCKASLVDSSYALNYPNLAVKIQSRSEGSTDGYSQYTITYKCTACESCLYCNTPLGNNALCTNHNVSQSSRREYSSSWNHYIHLTCLSAQEAKEAQFRIKLECEGQAATKQHRINSGLCIKCGKSLGVFDRMTGRKQHNEC